MNLHLATVKSCTNQMGIVQTLDTNEQFEAHFAAPIVEYGIAIEPGHFVAIDHSVTPPQIVYRFESAGDNAVNVDGTVFEIGSEREATVRRELQQAAFPVIEALYATVVDVDATEIKNVVRQSYDTIADAFLDWNQSIRIDERERYTTLVLESLPSNTRLLELGCGGGIPTTQRLAKRFQVTGVDISSRQIELARQHVENAEFLCADMVQLEFPAEHFDAVTAFYSIVHVPREEHAQLFRKIQSWLRPGGLFAVALGAQAQRAGYDDQWLGAPMYWSSFDSKTNQTMVEEAGFQIISATEETAVEDGETTTFLWIIARKTD